MWKIYDELIADVPTDVVVQDVVVGRYWVAVRAGGVGLAMTQRETGAARGRSGDPVGMKARDLAEWVKSWNFLEASIGLATINATVNAPGALARAGLPEDENCRDGLFARVAASARGGKVALIGHFNGIERLAEACDLTVLERCPGDGDLPDTACEYVLGGQDAVIVTATTLINKTLPRLLQLCGDAEVIVCGPSAPLSPVLFRHRVGTIGGVVVEDEDLVWRAVQVGLDHGLHGRGTRAVTLVAP